MMSALCLAGVLVQEKPRARILISRASRPQELMPEKPQRLEQVLKLAAAALKLPSLSRGHASASCGMAQLLQAAAKLRRAPPRPKL